MPTRTSNFGYKVQTDSMTVCGASYITTGRTSSLRSFYFHNSNWNENCNRWRTLAKKERFISFDVQSTLFTFTLTFPSLRLKTWSMARFKENEFYTGKFKRKWGKINKLSVLRFHSLCKKTGKTIPSTFVIIFENIAMNGVLFISTFSLKLFDWNC